MHDPGPGRRDAWSHLAGEQRQRLAVVDTWWSLLGRPVGQRLADVGCGPGLFAVRLAELGAEVLAVDVREDALAAIPPHPRIQVLRHDLGESPLPVRVDAAVLADVLHHLHSPARFLRNLRASTGRVVVAESASHGARAPGAPRLAAPACADLLREAGFLVADPRWPTPDQYVLLASSGPAEP